MSMPPDDAARLDLAAVRARLAGKTGRALWRSLDEVVDTPAFRAFLEAEFPRHAPPDGVERREFLKLMAASLGLAGLAACTRQPEERIVPYTTAPEGWIPGVPRWFATAVTLEGWAVGVLAESHEGRPTKLEGNPDHPASLGGADSLTQGAILELYDPDRSQALLNRGEIRPWSAFATELGQVRAAQLARKGRGLRILTGNVTSPTLIGQLEGLLAELPEARWHVWESDGGGANAYAGARLAYGTTVETYLRLESAATILVLDADLFGRGPGRVRHAKDVARGRKVRTPDGTMSRLWVVESCPTTVGSIADERLAVRSGDVEAVARAVAAGLGVAVPAATDHPAVRTHRRWIDAAVVDLRRAGRLATVVAGEGQPPAVHAIVQAVNARLGAVGRTVLHTEPFAAAARDDVGTLAELLGDIRAGAVEALVILDANPVYSAPGDLDVTAALDALPFVVHVGLHPDETAYRAHWHVPMAHSLESWSDARADDGTVTIIQPLVAPLYDGRTLHEVVAVLAGTPGATDHDLVRGRWLDHVGGERGWRHALHDGTVPGTAARPVRRRPVTDLGAAVGPAPAPAPGLEVVFRPDAGVWDGRYANNGWLQEVSRPVTLLTWDNAALLAPATAERLGVTSDDVIALTRDDRTIEAPVWVVPGHARDSATLALGYGRTRAGRVGTGVGVDVAPLRTHDALHLVHDVGLRPTGRRYALATTQHHQTMEGRDPARMGTLAEFRANPQAVSAPHPPVEGTSLYPPHPYEGNAWGMVIDVGACIGCNACVTACIAENNIAVVGRDQVRRGREMHWIRVDRYYAGGLDDPRVLHQPVPCMHCEDAPCEVVCPVNATVHSSEGLNEMVYNRCVGTRYCSNNCPYKVRRFNFYLFSDWNTESLKLQRNPEVTVRSRGVMEKCTYCVQRIEEKRALAKREERPIRDGEIVPACQQTCPTDAIVFGNLNDGESRVAHLRRDPLHYALLAELGTRPRTTYLAGLRNPSPDLDEEETG